MKKFLMFMALLSWMGSIAFSQGTGEIRGRVLDSLNNETMPGANVLVNNGSSSVWATTDNDGNFVLKPLPAGNYTVEITFTGYRKYILDKVKVTPDQITRVGDIALSAGDNVLKFEKHEYVIPLISINPTPIITVKDIESFPGKTDITKIIEMITPGSMRTEDGGLYFRGARDNDFIYVIDGMVSRRDVSIPSIAIGSIQVYTGGVPARYGDFTGGCIVIETQSYFSWLSSQNN